MPRVGLARAWLVLSLAWTACSKPNDSPKPSPAGSVSTAPGAGSAHAPTASPPALPPRPIATKPACRALAVSGLATVDGMPLTTSALLDGAHWVELTAGASVSLRHTLSSREFKLIGPGRALPCRDGQEQILLADGRLSTSAGLGVRPGAEVLIATPEGVVHYGDAALDLEFGKNGLRIRVKQGDAWVEPEEQAKPRFKNPLRSGAEARLPRTRTQARARLAACQSAADNARETARRVLQGEGAGGSDSLGARAATHMRERAQARTSCAIAAAAAYADADPADRQSLLASVARADERWQSVPRGEASP